MHTAEGRVLYRPGAEKQWVYEYHLQDHLGNLRMSVRDGEQTSQLLSMEPALAVPEEQAFERVSTTRHKGYRHSRSGDHAARLNARQGDLLGPGKRLQVKKGDQLKVEVYGHYQPGNRQPLIYSLAAFLAGNAVVQAVEAPQEGVNSRQSSFPFLSAGLAFAPQVVQRVKGAPQAYVRFIAYDSTGSYLTSGYKLLTQAAQDNWQQLQLAYTARQDGYVEVFTANESGQDAYFDDLLLTVQSGLVVQENHYDPWGLNLVGIETQGDPDHKYQYNGKEKQEEFGLGWNDYGARFFDPQLGRWHVVDPMTESQEQWTPYHYVYDNPILRTDPDGRCPDGDCPEISVAGILVNTAKDLAVSVGNVAMMGSGPINNAYRFSRDENGTIQFGYRGFGATRSEVLANIGSDLLDGVNVITTFGTGGMGGAGLLMAKTGAKSIITNAIVQEAKSSANAIKLRKQLASEAQMAEPGNPIIGHTPQKPLRIASELAAKHGGAPKDYVKKGSTSYTTGQEMPFETHWEENLITRQRFNEKTKLVPDDIPLPFKVGWRYKQKIDKIKDP